MNIYFSNKYFFYKNNRHKCYMERIIVIVLVIIAIILILYACAGYKELYTEGVSDRYQPISYNPLAYPVVNPGLCHKRNYYSYPYQYLQYPFYTGS